MRNSIKYPAIIFALVLFSAFLFIAFVTDEKDRSVPGFGPYKVFAMKTGSMDPKIKQGSLLVTKRDDVYLLNDVLNFNSEGETVTHRVVRVQGQEGQVSYETQGDANPVPDEGMVSKKDVNGFVIVTIPYLGYVVSFFKSPVGILSVVFLLAVIFLLVEKRTKKS